MTEEKVYLNEENFDGVKQMLTSNDEGSHEVAYTLLNNLDYEDNKVFIFCLFKDLNNENYFPNGTKMPELTKAIEIDKISIANISFRTIYETAVERNNKNELSFVLNLFKRDLISILQDYGFSFLEYLDIEIKPKKV